MKYILLFLMLCLAGFDAHAKMIASGRNHVCELSDGGTVKCWGYNDDGQLGIGVAGPDQMSPLSVPDLDNVTALTAGGYHTCALLQSRKVKCWGYNGEGELGIGVAGASKPSPQDVLNLDNVIELSAGEYHTCALLEGGTVKCWGDNDDGQLGIGFASNAEPSPQDVPNPGVVVALSLGERHTCALLQGGMVKCWGDNEGSQLGVVGADQPSPQDVPNLGDVIVLSAGGYHTCALLEGGTVKCWGYNNEGQLGIGFASIVEPLPQDVPNLGDVIALGAGGNHTCALLEGGTVKCWGYNAYGQLGIGVVGVDQSSPQAVPNLDNVIALSTGSYHTCALLQDGTVECWGENARGQLGIGAPSLSQPSPQDVPNLGIATAISAGGYHTCALLQGGTVKCWGYNGDGQLGIGVAGADQPSPQDVPLAGNIQGIGTGYAHTCAWLIPLNPGQRQLYCWGADNWGQLGNGAVSGDQPSPQFVVGGAPLFAVGASSSCAKIMGAVACWGANSSGQLGTGGFSSPGVPQTTAGFQEAVSLAIGAGHACALKADGTVSCAGNTIYGQLGNGVLGYSAVPRVVGEVFANGFE